MFGAFGVVLVVVGGVVVAAAFVFFFVFFVLPFLFLSFGEGHANARYAYISKHNL